MDKGLKVMLKKISMFYLILAAFIFSLSMIWIPKYALAAVCGVIVALLSFCCNTLVASYAVDKKGGNNFAIILGFILRVVLVSLIGLLFFLHNRYDVLAYMLGYSTNFFAMIFYGVSVNSIEGK